MLINQKPSASTFQISFEICCSGYPAPAVDSSAMEPYFNCIIVAVVLVPETHFLSNTKIYSEGFLSVRWFDRLKSSVIGRSVGTSSLALYAGGRGPWVRPGHRTNSWTMNFRFENFTRGYSLYRVGQKNGYVFVGMAVTKWRFKILKNNVLQLCRAYKVIQNEIKHMD